MMENKGLYDLGRKAIYMIIAVIIISFVFMYAKSIFVGYQAKHIRGFSNLEPNIIFSVAVTSPHCFAYYDEEIGRTYPGVIDFSKFNDYQLENCFVYTKKKVSFSLGNRTVSYNPCKDENGRCVGHILDNHNEVKYSRSVLVRSNESIRTGVMTMTFGGL